MIGFRQIQYKELPYSIILCIGLLSVIGLIVLYSISQHQDLDLLSNPFNKQLMFFMPSIVIAIIIIFIPRYTIHKYSYLLYIFGIVIAILPFETETIELPLTSKLPPS